MIERLSIFGYVTDDVGLALEDFSQKGFSTHFSEQTEDKVANILDAMRLALVQSRDIDAQYVVAAKEFITVAKDYFPLVNYQVRRDVFNFLEANYDIDGAVTESPEHSASPNETPPEGADHSFRSEEGLSFNLPQATPLTQSDISTLQVVCMKHAADRATTKEEYEVSYVDRAELQNAFNQINEMECFTRSNLSLHGAVAIIIESIADTMRDHETKSKNPFPNISEVYRFVQHAKECYTDVEPISRNIIESMLRTHYASQGAWTDRVADSGVSNNFSLNL